MDNKRPIAAADIVIKINGSPVGTVKKYEVKSRADFRIIRAVMETETHAEPAKEEHIITLRKLRIAGDAGTLRDIYGTKGFTLGIETPKYTLAFENCRFTETSEACAADGYLAEEAKIFAEKRTVTASA